jgi:hypothetical protein
MAREVTSRTRAAYDADVTLRLAGEAIVARVGEAVNRLQDPRERASRAGLPDFEKTEEDEHFAGGDLPLFGRCSAIVHRAGPSLACT